MKSVVHKLIIAYILLCSIGMRATPTSKNIEISSKSFCSLPKRHTGKSHPRKKCSLEKGDFTTAIVENLLEEYWQWKLSEYPEDATLIGIHKYDDRLTNVSKDAFDQRYAEVLKYLGMVEELLPCIEIYKDLQKMKILKQELSDFQDGHEYNGYYFPGSNLYGFHSKIKQLFSSMPLETHEDYQKMILRMEKIPDKIDQIISLMKAGMAIGLSYHYHSIKGFNETLTNFVVKDPSTSIFFKSFAGNYPSNISINISSVFQRQAFHVIKHKIVPGFEKFRVFISKEYKTRSSIAAGSLPQGKEFYARLVKIHTSSDYTPKQIHEIGLCEVRRITAEMKKVSKELGFSNKTVEEVTKELKKNPKNYYKTSQQLLRGYGKIVQNIQPHLPKVFKRIPKSEVIIESDASPYMTSAYYKAPPLYESKRPGVFTVATHDMKSHPKYNMVSLTLHEASPGHHYQNAQVSEYSDVPRFKRAHIGEWQYLPSGFSSPTAYSEGWALYAEVLGYEMELFNDPLDKFGQLTWEMLRACRLVVDTALHDLDIGWTREQAIRFMEENLAFDRNSLINQVDRYINSPGQALAYKIGQMRLLEMRQKAESELGSAFDLKEFHEVILNNGNLHLDMVEEQINKYISDNSI